MADIQLRGVRKIYPGGVEAVRGVDLDVGDGQFCVFVGPSGCGKSTLLRMIAGLESISAGDVTIAGTRVNDLPPSERSIAMVFQSYALYPHMSVAENMGFGLKMAGQSKQQIGEAVGRAAEILRIEPLLARKPKELSGGQRQRVAIGRAIVRKPKVFLFDEPLSNLDAALRVQMRLELAQLHAEIGNTMVYVTHDQVEAMTLGDRIAVFNGGRIEQVGTPLELYERPANRFVGGFLGSPRMNFIEAHVAANERGQTVADVGEAGQILLGGLLANANAKGRVTLGVRAENLVLADDPHSADSTGTLAARVRLVEHLGDALIVHASLAGQSEPITLRLPPEATRPATGHILHVRPRTDRTLVFDAEGRGMR